MIDFLLALSMGCGVFTIGFLLGRYFLPDWLEEIEE